MIKVHIIDPALAELRTAAFYYNTQSEGLGDQLADEVLKALDFLKSMPEGCRCFHENYRRCPLKRFPYFIIYEYVDNQIYVISIFHQHRDPVSWRQNILAT